MRFMVACCSLLLTSGLTAAQQPDPQTESARLARWHYKNGVDLMRAEQWEEAATEFKSATAIDPLMALAHYNLGQCRMPQKRYVEAVAAYKAASEALVRQSSLSEKERGERERARQDELNELKDSLRRLDSIESKQGPRPDLRIRIEDRIRVLEQMRLTNAAVVPIPAEFSLALGSAYFRQEKFEEAEREYKAALGVDKKLGPAHNNLAVIYLLTGRLEEAEAAVKAAEKSGFQVNPRLKEDIKKARAK